MESRFIAFFQRYFRFLLSLIITICLVRLYEYFAVASKIFVSHSYRFELLGMLYDIWNYLIFGCFFLLFYFLIELISLKLSSILFHTINTIHTILYVSLIVVFSERNTPFDHEFFTRDMAESFTTAKQMMTSGYWLFLPFAIYIALYYLIYYKLFAKIHLKKKALVGLVTASFLSMVFFVFSNPSERLFNNVSSYYLTCNKLGYFIKDSYKYFINKGKYDASKLTSKELAAEIAFYQQSHPFQFTNSEYPLLHTNDSKDVLGNYFNLDKTTPPNIVIIVWEGLSRDFSGEKAYASSFTPFLDSLSKSSLVWDNFLSTAPGTFAAHPAISGSLPYGKRGFSAINIMPDHLSLIKIFKANGYHTKFMIGFNPDFDNMGGYIRLQGTDMVLEHYPAKYKEMGVGEEGWSMGYPDDALYSRTFEVMDSLKQTPYLNIFHTATSHMPYLFEQKPLYEKMFDAKLKTLNVTSSIKKTLKQTKKVLTTFMFADDCLKTFFANYSKRKDFANTIFFITGDHHIGSFPSTCSADDYHVPFVVYSPMLKAPKKFYSVNSHNNIAPTITALLLNNYKMKYHPKEVHWVADVIDTCATFRNTQSMPFMAWSREINDYIYKEYMLSNEQLYRLTPDLLQEKVRNDSVKNHISKLLNNYKIINSYVCDNNKIFPQSQMLSSGQRTLLYEHYDTANNLVLTKSSDTILLPELRIPKEYKFLYMELSSDVKLLTSGVEDQPAFRLALLDTTNGGRNYLHWSNRDIVLMTKDDYVENEWNAVSNNDMFTLGDYASYKNLVFNLGFYSQKENINLRLKNLKLKVYGVK